MNTYQSGTDWYERVLTGGRVHVRRLHALRTRCDRSVGSMRRVDPNQPITCRDCLTGLSLTNGGREVDRPPLAR